MSRPDLFTHNVYQYVKRTWFPRRVTIETGGNSVEFIYSREEEWLETVGTFQAPRDSGARSILLPRHIIYPDLGVGVGYDGRVDEIKGVDIRNDC